jgi:hypothetical protein
LKSTSQQLKSANGNSKLEKKMKKRLKSISAMIGFLSVVGVTTVLVPFGQESYACMMGGMGGMGYMPQQRNSGSFDQNAIITRENAIEIVTRHINRLNPELRIGKVTDVGPVYEAEIISPGDEEILQIIGVHKQSGQLVIVN